MSYKKAFFKNYINIKILNKSFFKVIVKTMLKIFRKRKKINSDIIEIHNRPNILYSIS